MKLASLSFTVAAVLTAFLAPARAEEHVRPCDTKATCKRTLSCPSGFQLHTDNNTVFVCRKAKTDVQTASISCESGETMKHQNGTDVCEKDKIVTPTCKMIGAEAYKWDASEKKCKRVSKPDTWKTQNIKCPSGTTYKASSGKCEGKTQRPVWSPYDLDVCDELLEDGAWAQDWVGNKDMCVSSSTEYTWKAPTLD